MSSDHAAVHARNDLPGQSADALFIEVYHRLKAMASRQRGRAVGATLDTTALVHELYLRLNNTGELSFSSQEQFFDYASQAMRHILLDHARDRASLKRGGEIVLETDSAARQLADETAQHTIELDDALRRLEREDPRAARLVVLHYFGGLSLLEIANITGMATRTLNRDWRFARAFLYRLLR